MYFRHFNFLRSKLDMMIKNPNQAPLQQALAYVQTYTFTASLNFPNLPPDELKAHLLKRIQSPEQINQDQGTNFCWAAAITYILWQDDPLGLTKATIELYNTGSFQYQQAKAKVSPAAAVAVGSAAFYNNMDLDNKVDQMLFMTLADEEEYKGWTNIDQQYHPEDEEDATWSGRVFNAILQLYQDIGYEIDYYGGDFGNTVLVKDQHDYFEESQQALASDHVILFVNADRFKQNYKNWLDKLAAKLRFFGNHYLRLGSIRKASGEEYVIEFWDYGTWKTKLMTKEFFNQSTFGILALKKP